MEYRILTASSFMDLEKAVNESISEGWVPVGGAGAVEYNEVDDDCDWMCFQAMTKNEPKDWVIYTTRPS